MAARYEGCITGSVDARVLPLNVSVGFIPSRVDLVDHHGFLCWSKSCVVEGSGGFQVTDTSIDVTTPTTGVSPYAGDPQNAPGFTIGELSDFVDQFLDYTAYY